MPITQHRPVAALAGRRFGSFASKTEGPTSSHPVGKIIQAYSHGVTSGRRYGSFAGKAEPGPGGGWELEAPLTAEFSAAFDASGSIAVGVGVPGVAALAATFGATGSFSFASGLATQLVVSVPDAANLSGVNGLVLSAASPGAGVTVIGTVVGGGFDGDGLLTIDITGLGVPIGARRYVVLSQSDGTLTQSSAPFCAQGPVAAS